MYINQIGTLDRNLYTFRDRHMTLKNSEDRYGLVSVILHWLIAISIIGLYLLGSYIVDLSYYDPAYKTLPALHKALGVILFALVLARILWTFANPRPAPAGKATELQVQAAKRVHQLLYILMLVIPISGYLISTADGRPVDLFGLITLPALELGVALQEELAGTLHLWSANLLIAMVTLHALAALKHHFINRDQTLIRILGLQPERQP